jgi:hypothetical protein
VLPLVNNCIFGINGREAEAVRTRASAMLFTRRGISSRLHHSISRATSTGKLGKYGSPDSSLQMVNEVG